METLTSTGDIDTLVSATTEQRGVLTADDLRDVDQAILAYLDDAPVTPAYARKRLEQDGDEYSRGYVQQRLARLEEHHHVENLLDVGLYKLVDDPRSDTPPDDESLEQLRADRDGLQNQLAECLEELEDCREQLDQADAPDVDIEGAREALQRASPDAWSSVEDAAMYLGVETDD